MGEPVLVGGDFSYSGLSSKVLILLLSSYEFVLSHFNSLSYLLISHIQTIKPVYKDFSKG